MMLRRYHGVVKEERKELVAKKPEKVEAKSKPILPSYDDVTKADIRELLDERKVAYNKRDNKDELYSLLTESE